MRAVIADQKCQDDTGREKNDLHRATRCTSTYLACMKCITFCSNTSTLCAAIASPQDVIDVLAKQSRAVLENSPRHAVRTEARI